MQGWSLSAGAKFGSPKTSANSKLGEPNLAPAKFVCRSHLNILIQLIYLNGSRKLKHGSRKLKFTRVKMAPTKDSLSTSLLARHLIYIKDKKPGKFFIFISRLNI